MRKKNLLLLIFTLFVSIYWTKSFNMPDISDTLYIGQLINIELDLSNNKPERLFVSDDRNNSQIAIYDLIEVKEKPWNYLLRIAPFDTGFIKTDRIPVYLLKDNTPDTVFVEPFSFYVKSSLTYADTLLKDIAPPVSYRLKFIDYLIPLLIFLIVIVIIVFLSKIKKKDKEIPVFVDNRPAWMIALELLEELKQKNLVSQGEFLEFYFQLSLIFRIFIEKQYMIKAAEMTTYEIKQALSDVSEKTQIINILTNMDKIKFAKSIPGENESEEVFAWIEKYIKSFQMRSN